jgi:hypothetical protein
MIRGILATLFAIVLAIAIICLSLFFVISLFNGNAALALSMTFLCLLLYVGGSWGYRYFGGWW